MEELKGTLTYVIDKGRWLIWDKDAAQEVARKGYAKILSESVIELIRYQEGGIEQ